MRFMNTLPSDPCVYKIRNAINGRLYIGSTLNPGERRRRHFKDLRQGVHRSRFMQRDFDKCGEAAFTFTVLEVVCKELMLAREQHWLDTAKPDYNSAKIAGNSRGVKHSIAVVEANRARAIGFGNGNAKVTAEAATQIVALCNTLSNRCLAERFGVNRSTIERLFKRLGVKKSAKVYSEESRERARLHAIECLSPARRMPVLMYDPAGRLLQQFPSLNAAASHLGVNSSTVSEAISKGYMVAGHRLEKRDAAMLVIGVKS